MLLTNVGLSFATTDTVMAAEIAASPHSNATFFIISNPNVIFIFKRVTELKERIYHLTNFFIYQSKAPTLYYSSSKYDPNYNGH